MRVKLKAVTFCLNEKPIDALMWCNKVPKGRRSKPSKINGVQHHEVGGELTSLHTNLSSLKPVQKVAQHHLRNPPKPVIVKP